MLQTHGRGNFIKSNLFGDIIEPSPWPELVEFKRQTGFSAEALGMGLLDRNFIITSHVILSDDEIIKIIENIENTLVIKRNYSGINSIIMRLVRVNWQSNELITKKLLSMVNTIESNIQYDVENLSKAAVILLVNLLDNGKYTQAVIDALLRTVSKSKVKQIQITISPKRVGRVLSYLKAHLKSLDPDIRVGTIRITGALIQDSFNSMVWRVQEKLREKSYRYYFNLKLSKQIINDEDKDLRIDGIMLLALSRLNIEKESEWILQVMGKCINSQEAQAWAFFIRFAGAVGDINTMLMWQHFLEFILDKSQKYRSEIRSAALYQYERLVLNQSHKIDETYLDLPLATVAMH